MKRVVLGTAGHIDHGKTTLIKALTGVDCDRLKEEKERGITIELGFAHLRLPGGAEVGIVDVPAHERFVRHMVAGAAGMDLVLLVIAADEGIMPQTREHLDICRMLGIRKGIVVLTKRDTVGRTGWSWSPALNCRGYSVSHDVMQRGLQAMEFFELNEGDRTWLQSCISPVWDTALAVRALAAAGLAKEHPALKSAAAWLLSKQIFKTGDWAVKCPEVEPGGWAFEFVNNWYRDVDDSSMVLVALKEALENPEEHQWALSKGLNWCLGLECTKGGFASFDMDNTKTWLNLIPFADLKALVDPPTEDITARVLEMMGAFGYGREHPVAKRSLDFIRRTQHADGAWYGRWGVNYLYGTWSVLVGLNAIGEDMSLPYVCRAAAWLKETQNPDGGWGECCECYRNPEKQRQRGGGLYLKSLSPSLLQPRILHEH